MVQGVNTHTHTHTHTHPHESALKKPGTHRPHLVKEIGLDLTMPQKIRKQTRN